MAGYNNECNTCKYKSTCAGGNGNRKCGGYEKEEKKWRKK